MEWDAWVRTILGVGCAATSVYGYIQNQYKKKLEEYIEKNLTRLACDIRQIKKNAGWGNTHFRKIHEAASNLESSDLKKIILDHAHEGGGDVKAAERLLEPLFSEIATIKEILKSPDKTTR